MLQYLQNKDDPFRRFGEILSRAEATGMQDPNAMVLSTVDPDGRPLSRNVLLKGFDERGFVFFTNLESRKGRDLAENPQVCMNFYWRELGEQIIIQGIAHQVSDAEADAYFASRDRNSRLGAWASKQSRPLSSRAELLAAVAKYEARYLGRSVPRPPYWSGFRVEPTRIEFWTNGLFRLHRRIVFERSEDSWKISRLYP